MIQAPPKGPMNHGSSSFRFQQCPPVGCQQDMLNDERFLAGSDFMETAVAAWKEGRAWAVPT